MSVSTMIQSITRVCVSHHDAGEYHKAFDCVRLEDGQHGSVELLLPAQTGLSVAQAINDALRGPDPMVTRIIAESAE